jgi:hypothetical protein
MTAFIKKNYWLILIMALPFFIYLPSLFVFYTNDDFFFLKISHADSLLEFIRFFDILKGPEGFGMYRPLSTQVFYFLAWVLFNLNPVGLHIISFITLFGILYLISKLVTDLGGNKNIAVISTFLYGTSATHFGHMYYLATFQELLMTFFVLLSCISFFRKKVLRSLAFFVLALMSKETAVVTPLLLVLIFFYQKSRDLKAGNLSKLTIGIFPFVLILAVYLGFRLFSYGFAAGDTYIWDLSIRRLANTFGWYFVWSLNIPETFIDFIGPGITINPNLFKYWQNEATAIFTLFIIEFFGLGFILLKALTSGIKKIRLEVIRVLLLCSLWFAVSLLPVAFLPIHKFAYFLTLPLVGIAMAVAFLINSIKLNKIFTVSLLVAWLLLSVTTIKHSAATSWITNGVRISQSVYGYFKNANYDGREEIVFVDTKADASLPWSPTETVKVALSDRNFFAVFYPRLAEKISYSEGGGTRVESRQFLGY